MIIQFVKIQELLLMEHMLNLFFYIFANKKIMLIYKYNKFIEDNYKMEGRISIFENFALISVIMPYYASTHRAFLLLSSLWSGSRNKLNEFYDEFVFTMKKYITTYSINSENDRNKILLPSDLFEFSITVNNSEDASTFIYLIELISNKKGWYFNKHYMHKRMHILRNKILIQKSFIQEFNMYVESMKQISIWDKIVVKGEIIESPTLLDTIVIINLNYGIY